jgi:hypothetical protein
MLRSAWIASVLGDIADLLSAIAWPAVILAVVWFLREPIRALADRVSTSAEALSVGAQGLSIQLGKAVTHVPGEAETALAGVRRPDQAPRVVDSAALTMFAQLNLEAPAPYLTVDLGAGREWLTSRLFIFSILLRAMRRTQVLVFLETAGDVRGRFVGMATCERVRWSLAHAYPWLEEEYARAYANATSGPPVPPRGRRAAAPPPVPPGEDAAFVTDTMGRLAESVAHRVATGFVFAVQNQPPVMAGPPPADWVVEQRPDGVFAEHASWLSGADVERLLGDALHRFAYVRESTPGEPADRARAALRVPDEDVVAIVDENHRFRELIVDRREALEALAGDMIRREDGQERSTQPP